MTQRFEFRLPDVGEGVHEGEIVAWHVKVGDLVHEHDAMVEVMTDKATVSIGAPRAGTVLELRVAVGATAKVGEVLVVLGIEGAGSVDEPAAARPATTPSVPPPRPEGVVASAVGDIREGLPGSSFFAGKAPPSPEYFCEKPLATPSTRKVARELGIDLRRVLPTGPHGRVTADDVRRHQHHHDASIPEPGSSAGDVRVPLVGLRRTIAARMQHAVTTAAHFTFVEECDVGRLIAMREALRPRAKERGLELHFLPFAVRAVALALRQHPRLNCQLDEAANELVFRSEIHVGVATATPQGLLVPVVRDADRLTLFGLAREIERLATAAREGTIKAADLRGSTFTITSLGKQGGLLATPVLNLPEVGILGLHQIKRKPVVRGERIEIGDIQLVSLTCDHRFVDGHVAAAFAYDVIRFLEQPELLFADLLDG